MNEMDEFILDACENAKLYKELTKLWHDKHILVRHFELGYQVLLCNSRVRPFMEKLKSKWSDPFIAVHVFPHGVVEIKDERTSA